MVKQTMRCLCLLVMLALGAAASGSASTRTATGTSAASARCNVPFAGSVESGLPTRYPTPKAKHLTIGLLDPNRSTEVLSTMFDAAKAEIKKLGGHAIELDAQLDPDTQVRQFESLLDQKVDAISGYGILGPSVLAPLLKKAAAAQIPVVLPDLTPGSRAKVPGVISQIWQGRDRLAYLQAKAACQMLPAHAKVALIGLAVPVPLFQYMAKEQQRWARKFGLNIVATAQSPNDTVSGGQQAATGLLARYPDLQGILGYNDEPAIGAALAARSAGRQDVKTFGVEAGSLGRSAIKNGRLTASVFLDARDEGTKMAMALYDAAEGVKIPSLVSSGHPYIVTSKNVDAVPEGGSK